MHFSCILQHIFCQHHWNNCLSDIGKMQVSLLAQSLLGALASQVKYLTILRTTILETPCADVQAAVPGELPSSHLCQGDRHASEATLNPADSPTH